APGAGGWPVAAGGRTHTVVAAVGDHASAAAAHQMKQRCSQTASSLPKGGLKFTRGHGLQLWGWVARIMKTTRTDFVMGSTFMPPRSGQRVRASALISSEVRLIPFG